MEVYQNGIAKSINHSEKLQIVKYSITDQSYNQAGASVLLETGAATEYRDWSIACPQGKYI